MTKTTTTKTFHDGLDVDDVATYTILTDRKVGTVISRSAKRLVWKDSKSGAERAFSLRANGQWKAAGANSRSGGRSLRPGSDAYRDPSF